MLLSKLALQPQSILQLTVTGFLTVAGILIVALFITARQIDDLGASSQRVLSESANGMEAVRILIQQTTAMERNARQYQVVLDDNLLNIYRERQRSFVGAVARLVDLQLDENIQHEVEQIQRDEEDYFGKLLIGSSQETIQSIYQSLRERSYGLNDLLANWTTAQLGIIQQETASTQRLLRTQAIVLTSVALLLAALFTTLITRPLGQLEKAINRLGSGSYDAGVVVRGPADLRKLGSSLDWLRSRLQKLEQQRTAFFRHVSHELKTPLASIQESAALLRDGVAGPVNPEQLKLLAIHNNNCQRLQGLIDELLRYHKEIQSLLNAVPQQVRLDQVIASVVDTYEFALQTAGLRTEVQLEKLAIMGDAEQLRVVVDNLLTNAIKFSPAQGRIFLRWQLLGDRAVLEVEDQGPGIAPEERELVFQAFYQGTPPSAGPARNMIKSSGLGLAIVQEYVSANRGIIEVVPCTTGALFRVVFPLTAA
ncbi:MAG: HAMP domain-containing sensor histidine kinase [Pseudomonadota bacterium]